MNEAFDFQKHGKAVLGVVVVLAMVVIFGWLLKGQMESAEAKNERRRSSPEVGYIGSNR